MKKLIALIVIIVAATGAYAWYAKTRAAASSTTQPTATVTLAHGNIFLAVSATGRVVSNLDVDIKCQASGEIVDLPYDVSQSVKKDDLLVQLNPVDENRAVKQATVSTKSSQAKLAQAKQNLIIAQQNLETAKLRASANLASAQSRAKDARLKSDRRKALFEQNLTSREDYDTASTTADQADADVKTAQAQVEDLVAQKQGLDVKQQDIALAQAEVDANQIALDDANQRLIYTKVISPMDGVVSALNVQKGVIVASGTGGFSGGTTLMTLSDLSHIFVLASVDESDIGQVKLDSDCLITADAFPGKRFRGKVVRIATKGVNTTNVVTFEVKIEVLGNNKSLLKPEMTANVQIVSAQKDDVLVIPTMAVSRKAGNTVATLVLPDGKQEERPFTAGLIDGDNYEVLTGLNEGDTVLLHKDETNSRWNGGGRSGSLVGGMGGGRRGGGR